MPARQVFNGVVNRSRGSIKCTDGNLQQLNIDANSLGQNGITIRYEGDAADIIDMMTHHVPSPKPTRRVRIEVDLSRISLIRNGYVNRIKQNCLIGGMIYTPMITSEDKRVFQQCVISSEGDLSDTGTTASSTLVIMGYETINDELFGAG